MISLLKWRNNCEERRKRGDLITAYKVFSKKDNVDPATWFTTFVPGGRALTRNQAGYQNVEISEWNREERHNFWSVRVCEPWNGLPDSVKMSESTDSFKNSLDNIRGWGRKPTGNKKNGVRWNPTCIQISLIMLKKSQLWLYLHLNTFKLLSFLWFYSLYIAVLGAQNRSLSSSSSFTISSSSSSHRHLL